MASLLASLMGGSTNAPVAATVDAAETSRESGETDERRSRHASEASILSLAGGVEEEQTRESSDEEAEEREAEVSERKSNGTLVETVEQFVQKHVALQHRITFLEKENAQLSTINLDLCEELSAVETKVEDMQILKSNAEKKLDDEKKAHEGTKKKLDSAMKDLEHFRTDSDRSNASLKTLSTFIYEQGATPGNVLRKRAAANDIVDHSAAPKKGKVAQGRPAAMASVTWRLSAFDTDAPIPVALAGELPVSDGINLACVSRNAIALLTKQNIIKFYRRNDKKEDFLMKSVFEANASREFAVQLIACSINLIAIATATGETSTIDIHNADNAAMVFRRFTTGQLWSVRLFDNGYLMWWKERIPVTNVDIGTLARTTVFDSSDHKKKDSVIPILEGNFVVCPSGLMFYAMPASRGFRSCMVFSVDARTGQRFGYRNPVRHGRLFANEDGTRLAVIDETVLKVYNVDDLPAVDGQATVATVRDGGNADAARDATANEALTYKGRMVEARTHALNGVNLLTVRVLKDIVYYVDATDTKLHRICTDSSAMCDAGLKIMDYLIVEVDGEESKALVLLENGSMKIANFV